MTAIQGDEVFTAFRRKLEDATLFAINSGIPIKRDATIHAACCPLGCIFGRSSRNSRPGPMVAADAWGIGWDEANSFAAGFDGIGSAAENTGALGAYFKLGALYRRRFP